MNVSGLNIGEQNLAYGVKKGEEPTQESKKNTEQPPTTLKHARQYDELVRDDSKLAPSPTGIYTAEPEGKDKAAEPAQPQEETVAKAKTESDKKALIAGKDDEEKSDKKKQDEFPDRMGIMKGHLDCSRPEHKKDKTKHNKAECRMVVDSYTEKPMRRDGTTKM